MRWRIAPQTLLESLSSAPKTFAAAAQIHQRLLASGLLSPSPESDFIATKLVQLYADAGDLTTALRLFSSLPNPNVFAWTSILAALSRSGGHRRCLYEYSRMRGDGVDPDGYVGPVVLRSAAVLDLTAVSAVHADAVKFGTEGNVHVSNALISAYSHCGDTVSGHRVFNRMDGRDLLSWNSMISAYVAIGSIKSALELLRSMVSDGCDPDLVTWNTIMDGYCRAGQCTEALKIFDRISNPNVVSWTIIILGYSRSGNHEAALKFFKRMLHEGLVPPDQDTLSCALSCCRHLAALRSGQEVHAYGLKAIGAHAFYRAAGAALVASYSGGQKIAAASRVFASMDPTEVVTWNALITGLIHAGMNNAALDQFRIMQSRGIGTDQTTVATVLPACNLKLGKEIHCHVARRIYENATAVWNALITMYSRSGCIWAARSLFRNMVSRDIISWNAMVNAYGSHGLGGPAVELVNEMNRAGIRPNGTTLTSALTACSHSGLVDEGLDLFERFKRVSGLDPGTEHYACVVDLLGRAGRFEEAVRFIREMPVGADGSVWGALMGASRVHQNVEFGRVAFEELVRVEPENAGNYVTMANLYVRVGRWEEGKKVRKLMENRGLVKPSGYSWIEVE